jgi:hypothetical protein
LKRFKQIKSQAKACGAIMRGKINCEGGVVQVKDTLRPPQDPATDRCAAC